MRGMGSTEDKTAFLCLSHKSASHEDKNSIGAAEKVRRTAPQLEQLLLEPLEAAPHLGQLTPCMFAVYLFWRDPVAGWGTGSWNSCGVSNGCLSCGLE